MTQRPEMGSTVHASDRIKRRWRRKGLGSGGWKFWDRCANNLIKAKPVDGIYIGFRTYSNGDQTYDYEEGHYYTAREWFEVWLIVPGPREKPVPVLPEDVT